MRYRESADKMGREQRAEQERLAIAQSEVASLRDQLGRASAEVADHLQRNTALVCRAREARGMGRGMGRGPRRRRLRGGPEHRHTHPSPTSRPPNLRKWAEDNGTAQACVRTADNRRRSPPPPPPAGLRVVDRKVVPITAISPEDPITTFSAKL